MILLQEGQLSSEDRLFMGSSPRYQTDSAQPNPFGGVSWEGGRPVYSAVGQNMVGLATFNFLFVNDVLSSERACC